MLDSIFETVIRGSNTVFLDIPEDDYFLSYNNISKEAAEDLTKFYFEYRGKDGTPEVQDIVYDPTLHRVKVTVKVDYDKNRLNEYKTPDLISNDNLTYKQ